MNNLFRRIVRFTAAGFAVAALLMGTAPSRAQDADTSVAPAPAIPGSPRAKPEMTVDALSVVRVRAQASANARSGRMRRTKKTLAGDTEACRRPRYSG